MKMNFSVPSERPVCVSAVSFSRVSVDRAVMFRDALPAQDLLPFIDLQKPVWLGLAAMRGFARPLPLLGVLHQSGRGGISGKVLL